MSKGSDIIGTKQRFNNTKALIKKCNLIDDEFFRVVANDTAFCEELLNIILGRVDIVVKSCNTQLGFNNLDSKSVVLDLVCSDETGSIFNVEIQKSNNDDIQKRMRYYAANIDIRNLKHGQLYAELPDVYSIMISDFDIFKEGKTVYHINRVLDCNGEKQNNGIHELFLNANGKDKSVVTDLMQYMLDSNGYNDKFPVISKRVQLYKEHDSEVDNMGSVFDEIRAEGKAEGKDEAVKEVLRVLGISKEEYEKRLAEQQTNC